MDRHLSWRQCVACGGVYQPVQADGTAYFHACAPILDPDTGVLFLPPHHRDENAPPSPVLAARIDAAGLPAGDNYHAVRNAYRATAMVSAGAGVADVDPERVAAFTATKTP